MKFRMSAVCLATLSLCALTVHPAAAGGSSAPVVKTGARVAVIGDSITEQKLYSRYIETYLVACQPQLDARVMQFGWSGERAAGFAGRMANDLTPFKPTVATTCYGMNDGRYGPYSDEVGKSYEDPMRDIVKRLKAAGAVAVVGAPGAVDTKYYQRGSPDSAKEYNATLARLRDIARRVAADEGMPFANVHDVLIETMSKAKAARGEGYDVCGGDGVHPAPNGQLAMAYAFLRAMGFDGDLGTITVDLAGPSSAANGHRIVGQEGGTVQIESARYPFCFSGDEQSSGSPRSILPFLPFQQDLNRLTLVVRNAKGPKVKVKWGDAAKVFDRADLEKGINLAAEFPETPFAAAFKRVDGAVGNKQAFETFMIKNNITEYPQAKRFIGEDAEALATLDAFHRRLWEREERLQAAVKAAFQPVKHTLVVEDAAP